MNDKDKKECLEIGVGDDKMSPSAAIAWLVAFVIAAAIVISAVLPQI